MCQTFKSAAKETEWSLRSAAEDTKFCPQCGSKEVNYVLEEQGRMAGGEVACNGCGKSFLIREFVN